MFISRMRWNLSKIKTAWRQQHNAMVWNATNQYTHAVLQGATLAIRARRLFRVAALKWMAARGCTQTTSPHPPWPAAHCSLLASARSSITHPNMQSLQFHFRLGTRVNLQAGCDAMPWPLPLLMCWIMQSTLPPSLNISGGDLLSQFHGAITPN